MVTDRPGHSDDDIDVRLQWPGADAPADPGSDELASPAPAAPLDEPVVPITEISAIRPIGPGGSNMSSVLIGAYDRLGDRLLERMRALRDDIDADLSALRSELASLRHAVDDVGDRVQLRALRATIDELRGDVAGLRRAVLEWPELEQVSSDIAGLRADVSDLLGRRREAGHDAGTAVDAEALESLREELAEVRALVEGGPGPSDELNAIREELGAIRELLGRSSSMAALGPLVEEVAAVREEMVSLRRRIKVRVGLPAEPDDPGAATRRGR